MRATVGDRLGARPLQLRTGRRAGLDLPRVCIEALAGERTLTIDYDGNGGWTVDGEWRTDLDGHRHRPGVTPFTNTLPIRRLDLAIDDEADITVACVVPDLEVTVDEQRYTRLDEDLYLFESLDSDFSREIEVDLDGVVVEYPGLFERL